MRYQKTAFILKKTHYKQQPSRLTGAVNAPVSPAQLTQTKESLFIESCLMRRSSADCEQVSRAPNSRVGAAGHLLTTLTHIKAVFRIFCILLSHLREWCSVTVHHRGFLKRGTSRGNWAAFAPVFPLPDQGQQRDDQFMSHKIIL